MRDEIKQARLAALFGLEAPKVPTLQEKREAANISREVESVILFAENRDGFKQVKCRSCHKTFAVNRANISCCSDACRVKHLSDNFGLDVDITARSPEERWGRSTGGSEPLVVPPPALEALNLLLPLPTEVAEEHTQQQVG